MDEAITANSEIALGIFRVACSELAQLIEEVRKPEAWRGIATESDCVLARACVRLIFRDWCQEGAPERAITHSPVLDALREEFDNHPKKGACKVLVPGAGLARLAYSISELGLSVEGNEISYHAMLISMYLFVNGGKGMPHTLYPWALSFSNHVSRDHQFQKVAVPDVYLSHKVRFSRPNISETDKQLILADGGFVHRYGNCAVANIYSVLVTCYFIDTAPNIMDYVDTAWKCLREGGIWINIGPLLWNTEENGPAGRGEGDLDVQESWAPREVNHSLLELTVEEVMLVLQQRGFKVEKSSSNVGSSTYVGNKSSMLQYTYNMAFWVVRKATTNSPVSG